MRKLGALSLLGVLSVSSPPNSPFLLEGTQSDSCHHIAFSVEGRSGQPAIIASFLPHPRNLTAFSGGAKELLLRDLDQLFLSSDCRHFNRTESLRCGVHGWGTFPVTLRHLAALCAGAPALLACSAPPVCRQGKWEPWPGMEVSPSLPQAR